MINMLNENKFKQLKRYVYLVTNAVVMGILDNPQSMKNNKQEIDKMNELLYNHILEFLKQLD